jgi:hypothetical protein
LMVGCGVHKIARIVHIHANRVKLFLWLEEQPLPRRAG